MSVRPVFSAADIERTLRRMGHEIVETIPDPSTLVLMGIPTRGAVLSQRLAGILEDIAGRAVAQGSLDITMYRDDLAGAGHRSPAPTVVPDRGIDGAFVVLVDDVLFPAERCAPH